MGFNATLQTESTADGIDALHEAIAAELSRLIGEHIPVPDPFKVTEGCPFNASGHDPKASCGEIVCMHCAKVFWR